MFPVWKMNIDDMKCNIMIVRIRVLCVLSALLAVGCSVKENRQDCPCRLMLDLSGIDTALVKVLNIQASTSEGIVFIDTLRAEAFSDMYVRNVTHDEMSMLLWGSGDSEEGLIIPYGKDCPTLYMSAFEADTRGEQYFRVVELNKNHCLLTVLFEGRQVSPYSLTFRGNVNGYDSFGVPSEGDFACVAYPGVGGESMVVVPRQTDSSLLLDVEDEGSSVLKTFAIGEYMDKSGYDWTEKDLEDVVVVLDYSVTGLRVVFKGWDKEYRYDVIL